MCHKKKNVDRCEFAQGPWEPQAPPGALSCHGDVNNRVGVEALQSSACGGFTPLIVP